MSRLDLVRTLRGLGLGLAVIRQVLDQEVPVPEIVAAHADALDVQIRTRLRHAVLRAVAERSSTPGEVGLMPRPAELFEYERQKVVNDFTDDVFGGLDSGPGFVALIRSAIPQLPYAPTSEQVKTRNELAELCHDADFRAVVRRMTGATQPRTGLHMVHRRAAYGDRRGHAPGLR
jgi:hypothetical protein